MKPPIPSPDGQTIREEKLEFDGKEKAVAYRASVISITRLQLKCAFFNPVCYAVLVVVIACLLLLPIIWPIRNVSFWRVAPLMVTALLLLCLFLIPILMPLHAIIQLCVRGYDESIVVGADGVRAVAKRFPIFIAWKRVLWVVNWSGDVFIATIGGGVMVPRHAFRTAREAEDFIHAAREFHLRRRETHRNTMPNATK